MWQTTPVANREKRRSQSYPTRMTVKVILECNLLLLLGTGANAATHDGLNAKPYGILCNIYNIAANPPNSLYDETKVAALRREIDAINVSLSDAAWFNEISNTNEPKKLSDEFKTKNDVSGENYERWRTAVKTVSTEDRFKKISSTGTTIKLARLKLKKIEEQAERILNDIANQEKAADFAKIKEKFDDAIGEKVGATDSYGISTTTRTNACGKANAAKGDKAGANLIVDFLCLCAAHTSNSCSSNTACGKECVDTDGSSNNWNAGAPTNAEAIWSKLKTGCKAIPGPKTATPHQGYQAISKFFDELRVGQAGTSGSNYKTGLLGRCEGTGGCSTGCVGSQTGNGGICVAYGPDDWENKITWLKNMKDGLDILKTAENKSAIIEHDIAQLQMLRHRAEEIYDETKASIENKDTDTEKSNQPEPQKGISTTNADKVTAQEPNAVSAASIQCFLLPWTLLI